VEGIVALLATPVPRRHPPIAGALTIDEFHNWYDIFLAGAVIEHPVMAISSYRMVYASVLGLSIQSHSVD